jgi:hypothetical protein
MASLRNPGKRPPRTVVFSVAIHAASLVAGCVYYAASGQFPRSMSGWAAWVIVACILFLYLRAIYLGYNWARWLSVALVVIGLAILWWALPTLHTHTDRVIYLVQQFIDITAAVLLFVPGSAGWYRSNYSVKQTLPGLRWPAPVSSVVRGQSWTRRAQTIEAPLDCGHH